MRVPAPARGCWAVAALCVAWLGCGGCPTNGSYGGPCADAADCPDGVCTDGSCLGRPASTCSGPSDCSSGVCTDGVCGAGALPRGSACRTAADCGSGQCASGVCVQGEAPVGASCTSGTQCGSGTCDQRLCTPDPTSGPATQSTASCRKIDLVFSVDNSGSMTEEHKAMRTTIFPAFARELRKIPGLEDFRVGVDDACPFPAKFKTRGTQGACTFHGGQSWMVSGSPNLEAEFACAGDIWSGDAKCSGSNDDEQPASTTAAMVEPGAGMGANPGFLRDDAVLVAVAITDEDEKYTPGPGPYDPSKDWPAQRIYDRLIATKGGNPKRMVFLGIGGKTECSGVYGDAIPATKLSALTDLFVQRGRGVFWDLCVGRLEDGLNQAMQVISTACGELPRAGGKGAPCSSHGQCASGVCTAGRCDGGGARPGGSACSGGSQCASGACTDGQCEGGPTGAPGGSACARAATCQSGACTERVCEEGPSGPGLPNGAACASGLQCASAACTHGTCAEARPGGSACTTASQCASGRCTGRQCDQSPGWLPPGGACASAAQCGSGRCTGGLCEGGPGGGLPAGGACSSGSQCASGTCQGGACVGGIFGGGLPAGAGCSTGFQCSSGTCLGGLCEGGSGGTGLPNGSACTANLQCASAICINGRCEAPVID